MSSHYFWAVKIPDQVKKEMDKRINAVKAHFPFQRWVHEQDYHITLAFLGAASQTQLQTCSKTIESAISGMKSFKLDIVGLDIFGQSSSPRVFWAAVAFEDQLMELQQLVYDECVKADFELEKRKYHPHITLARKWVGQEPFLKDKLAIYNPFMEPIMFQAEQIVLYTVNKDSRPKYEPITTLHLVGTV